MSLVINVHIAVEDIARGLAGCEANEMAGWGDDLMRAFETEMSLQMLQAFANSIAKQIALIETCP